MNEKIIAALKTLNAKADAQWTQEGLVALNAFKFAMGGEAVTREQLEEAAPGFTRENAETYFAPKDGAIEAAKIPEGNVATLTVGVEVNLADSLKTLMGIGAHNVQEISELTPEQLADIMKDIPDRRNALISLRSEFEALMQQEMALLIKLEEAYEASVPKENFADLVKRIHTANMSSKYIVDQPRQRVAPPIPPMKK